MITYTPIKKKRKRFCELGLPGKKEGKLIYRTCGKPALVQRFSTDDQIGVLLCEHCLTETKNAEAEGRTQFRRIFSFG